jgi:hypothetical protein
VSSQVQRETYKYYKYLGRVMFWNERGVGEIKRKGRQAAFGIVVIALDREPHRDRVSRRESARESKDPTRVRSAAWT